MWNVFFKIYSALFTLFYCVFISSFLIRYSFIAEFCLVPPVFIWVNRPAHIDSFSCFLIICIFLGTKKWKFVIILYLIVCLCIHFSQLPRSYRQFFPVFLLYREKKWKFVIIFSLIVCLFSVFIWVNCPAPIASFSLFYYCMYIFRHKSGG